MEKILEYIKIKRSELNITQKEMGEKLGISQGGHQKIETGFVELSMKDIYKIADIFNIGVGELLGLDKEKTEKNISRLQIEEFKKRIEELENRIEEKDLLTEFLKEQVSVILHLCKVTLEMSFERGYQLKPNSNVIISKEERSMFIKYQTQSNLWGYFTSVGNITIIKSLLRNKELIDDYRDYVKKSSDTNFIKEMKFIEDNYEY